MNNSNKTKPRFTTKIVDDNRTVIAPYIPDGEDMVKTLEFKRYKLKKALAEELKKDQFRFFVMQSAGFLNDLLEFVCEYYTPDRHGADRFLEDLEARLPPFRAFLNEKARKRKERREIDRQEKTQPGKIHKLKNLHDVDTQEPKT